MLSQKDLLLNQRVNTHWRDLIGSSPLLQRKLFFKVDVLPLDISNPAEVPAMEWNALLEEFISPSIHGHVAITLTKLQNWDYPAASWRKMHLSNPSSSVLRLFRRQPSPLPPCPWTWYGMLYDTAGTQLGLLTSMRWHSFSTQTRNSYRRGHDLVEKIKFPIVAEILVSGPNI